jgi:hypothetical protein
MARLFPCNLNALQIFFCRSDAALPRPVLRSDPSIECYSGDHWLAFAASLLVFAACAVATPAFLFRKIRQTLREQGEAHAKAGTPAAAEDLTQRQTDIYTDAFNKYDADGSGKIDDEELSCICPRRPGAAKRH